jgi:hypothetical protein
MKRAATTTASSVLMAQVIIVVVALLAPLAVAWLQPPPPPSLRRHQRLREQIIDRATWSETNSHVLSPVALESKSRHGVGEEDHEYLQRAYEAIAKDDTTLSFADLVRQLGGHERLRIIRAIFRDYYSAQLISAAVRALQVDFGIRNAIQAHCLRTALWQMYREEQVDEDERSAVKVVAVPTTASARTIAPLGAPSPSMLSPNLPSVKDLMNATLSDEHHHDIAPPSPTKLPRTTLLYKQVALTNTVPRKRTYSDVEIPSSLKDELETRYYQEFLIKATPETPTPLRAATAKTYLRHAMLFVQWYISTTKTGSSVKDDKIASLADILDESGDELSIQCFWNFCAYLRAERGIAKSYEANLWRGLGKLLKYRHHQRKYKNDEKELPCLALVRKWHRLAQQAAQKAPRQSNEEMKWLSWPQYLSVVQQCRAEYESLLEMYRQQQQQNGDDNIARSTSSAVDRRKIAMALQRYLVLAIFATVPDRQRTIRELEVGSTLCKVNSIWCIRHTSEKYKTGKTYGERPLLQLGPVTADIDAFWEHWRPALFTTNKDDNDQAPSSSPLPHNFLFVQVRTGRPLTQDSVYQMVGRTCYQYTGQRTNPHLLRDMIVTHVRQSSQASEKELEALGTLKKLLGALLPLKQSESAHT